ncbi:MAG: hypothetical protein IRZ14_09045 [Chloroflexi bacterium]|nr:hypothetical protein [Chloroflexota bacterium]
MNRKAIALAMPLAATGITVLIIVSIGTLLLEVRHAAETAMGHEGRLIPVAVALAIAGAILIGCALAARGGNRSSVAH